MRAQTAPPLAGTWDDDLTPLPEDSRSALAQVDRRVKLTGRAQLDLVDLLRTELRGDARDVHVRIDVLASRLAQVAADTAGLAGKLDVLLDEHQADRQADRRELATVRVEMVKADLGEVAARRAHRRRVTFRLLAGAGAVWSTVSALLLARGC